ncbi:hypothetical protein PPERSA_03483 [Pseudocohnilembus persalinus]|uniref:Uncharacterized protein n=1 Tax=Pseudocohnilembus persalinus TaxID=266149 RepID=A0A0V0QBX9_PSEPJ|nr:hypothetical protein PPERSA_03483 [Pseudocohnilembus persalinus]|eukprot:KRW99682.1 hypothetical protein PPERSA_03483 [Pseudocohnilembus persalinus]
MQEEKIQTNNQNLNIQEHYILLVQIDKDIQTRQYYHFQRIEEVCDCIKKIYENHSQIKINKKLNTITKTIQYQGQEIINFILKKEGEMGLFYRNLNDGQEQQLESKIIKQDKNFDNKNDLQIQYIYRNKYWIADQMTIYLKDESEKFYETEN